MLLDDRPAPAQRAAHLRLLLVVETEARHRDAHRHRMQVLIGTGDMRAEEAIGLANFAFAEDAYGVMVVEPWYFALTDDDVPRHFDGIAAGDYAATARYQKTSNDIVAIYGMTSPFMSGMKSALVDMGIFASGIMASPFAEAGGEQKAAIRDFLRSFHLRHRHPGAGRRRTLFSA